MLQVIARMAHGTQVRCLAQWRDYTLHCQHKRQVIGWSLVNAGKLHGMAAWLLVRGASHSLKACMLSH